MAIKISGTTVIDDSRNIDNIGNFCATTLFGDGSNITGLSTPDIILKPTNTSPADGATNIGDGPTLCASSYVHAYGIPKCCSQWQVDDNSDFSSPVFNVCQAGTATSTILSSGTLCENCTYYWRVRYFDNCGCCSQYSDSSCFTTCVAFPPELGESYCGGFYTGAICAAGTCYYLIVAPNATGCINFCAWKTANTCSALSNCSWQTYDGYCNTYTCMANVNHPGANWTATRTINSFSDWYLPAICEMREMFNNRGQMPAGEGYACDSYQSSSERDELDFCIILFQNGCAGWDRKTSGALVRAIRREPF